MNSTPLIIDRRAVRRNRNRAAADFANYDFLIENVADDLMERLADSTRRFPRALDLGGHTGALAKRLTRRTDIDTLLSADSAEAMVERAGGLRLVADEEFLPIADGTLDLIMSCLTLHWINDLPGVLIQARRALKPDGLFLAAMFGGATLKELREAFLLAEDEIEGGAGPRVSPFADVRDAGDLLSRAGFKLPVAVTEVLTVSYETPFKLIRDLKGMGEANAHIHRRKSFTRRTTFLRALAIYQERFGDGEGRVPATFEIVTLTGWAPVSVAFGR
ncbi:MAG: putative SAM-dependent methyltransferase [Rhodospirillales bacterium]|nr:putative SAM-dependent methyltransferase [Rhodospirillales bacterium]